MPLPMGPNPWPYDELEPPGSHMLPCPDCRGTGWLSGSFARSTSSAQKSGPPLCFRCNGEGKRLQPCECDELD
jgi:DnaJ-class molecular chaperone